MTMAPPDRSGPESAPGGPPPPGRPRDEDRLTRKHLPLWDRLPTLAFWLIPSAIAAPVITRALVRAKKNPKNQPRQPSGARH